MKKQSKKQTKQGISLIVLVITIIVMIILAAAVILSLSSNGIIGRANEAVTDSNLAQVETVAQTIWAEIYLENREGANFNFATEVPKRLEEQGIDITKFEIVADGSGVTVELKAEDKTGPEITIITPASTDANNPTISETRTYTVTGYAHDSDGIKELTVECSSVSVFTISQDEYRGSFYVINEILSDDEASALVGQEAVITRADGTTVTFTITNTGSYPNGGVATGTRIGYSSYVSNISSGDIISVGTKTTIAISGDEITENGLWNADITLAAGSVTTINVIMTDNTDKTLSEIRYVFYNENRFIYGLYEEGAIDLYLAEGEEAIADMLILPWSDVYSLFGTTALSEELNGDLITPSTLTTIGDRTFYGCTSLTGILLPDVITSIGEYAFYGCTSLASVKNIPDGVTRIGNYAFKDCTGLTSIGTVGSGASLEIPDSVTTIGNNAFYNCTGLTEVTIPGGVTGIGEFAFYNCTALTTVAISGEVSTISSNTFNNCTSLQKITLPNSISIFASCSFAHCTNLNIEFNGTMEEWDDIYKQPYVTSPSLIAPWNSASGEITVTCTDGTVTIAASFV